LQAHIRKAHVSFVLPAGATQADEVREIASQFGWTIDSLPEQLAATTFLRGKTVFAYADVALDEISEQHGLQWDVQEGMLGFATPTPFVGAHLTMRETKIWEVIKLGSQGSQYCRELDAAGIRPTRKGVWENCPRNYVAAYRESELWRHRIQDEKTKIRRKGELAGLASE
jgi:hypothetical protein